MSLHIILLIQLFLHDCCSISEWAEIALYGPKCSWFGVGCVEGVGCCSQRGQRPPGAMQLSEPSERKAKLFGVVGNNLWNKCWFLCALAWGTDVFAEWLSQLMVWQGFVLLPWLEGVTPGVCQVVTAFWGCSEGLAGSDQVWISGNEWLHRGPKVKQVSLWR